MTIKYFPDSFSSIDNNKINYIEIFVDEGFSDYSVGYIQFNISL